MHFVNGLLLCAEDLRPVGRRAAYVLICCFTDEQKIVENDRSDEVGQKYSILD